MVLKSDFVPEIVNDLILVILSQRGVHFVRWNFQHTASQERYQALKMRDGIGMSLRLSVSESVIGLHRWLQRRELRQFLRYISMAEILM